MRFAIFAAALAALPGCATTLPPSSTCAERWNAYADDRMHGAMLGGLLGGSISGNKPTCNPE